ncbi:hypothetical protein STEG23_016294 [Scotinomys teguina]
MLPLGSHYQYGVCGLPDTVALTEAQPSPLSHTSTVDLVYSIPRKDKCLVPSCVPCVTGLCFGAVVKSQLLTQAFLHPTGPLKPLQCHRNTFCQGRMTIPPRLTEVFLQERKRRSGCRENPVCVHWADKSMVGTESSPSRRSPDKKDSALYPAPGALCPVPYALCSVPYVLCPVPCVLCLAPCALCPVPRAWCPVSCALCPVLGALCSVPGALCPVACGLCLVSCAWCPVPGALCPVADALCPVPGALWPVASALCLVPCAL